MRAATVALAAVLALAAGCGGGDDGNDGGSTSGAERWGGPGVQLGSLDVAAFEEYAGSVDEPWERSPVTVAAEYTRIDQSQASVNSVATRTAAEGGTRASALVVEDGLQDDSVRARQYTLALTQRDNGTWKLDSATAEQRCQAGRGHVDFAATPCT
jgi:hypothetical protein